MLYTKNFLLAEPSLLAVGSRSIIIQRISRGF
jgi:hypothetical protein